MLVASDRAKIPAGLPSFTRTVFDASVGYDLVGDPEPQGPTATSAPFKAIAADGGAAARAELPADLRPLAEPGPCRRTSWRRRVTLSTFHGCPPHEIEAIVGAPAGRRTGSPWW
jgi:hypothetical protein